MGKLSSLAQGLKSKVARYRNKRPHRSLRLTRRRDYLRPLNLPGYFSFTAEVVKIYWSNRRNLITLTAILLVFYLVLVGIGSQSTYAALIDFLKEAGGKVGEGDVTAFGQAGAILLAISSVGFGGELGEAQQIYSIFIIVFGWLVTVWMMRNIMAKRQVKVRDALYNAGAPIISTLILVAFLLLQFIPLAFAAVGYSAAVNSGLIDGGGVEAMLFWITAGGLTLISVYWSVSTFFALVIVTLPGTYPFKALSMAGDMMSGRRMKLVLRMLWLILVTGIVWSVILLLIIMLDTWLKGLWPAITWIPVVPFAVLVMTSIALVWASVYVYVLYRRIVDEDAKND